MHNEEFAYLKTALTAMANEFEMSKQAPATDEERLREAPVNLASSSDDVLPRFP
jgi:hypothetical protein